MNRVNPEIIKWREKKGETCARRSTSFESFLGKTKYVRLGVLIEKWVLPLEMFDCKYDNENFKKNKTYFICKWLHILCEYNIVVVVAKIDNKNIG